MMTCVQVQPEAGYASNSMTSLEISAAKRVAREGMQYSVRPCSSPTYFNGMGAEVVIKYTSDETEKPANVSNGDEKVVGTFCVIHPEVVT